VDQRREKQVIERGRFSIRPHDASELEVLGLETVNVSGLAKLEAAQ
jgi:hypothetical protein